MTRLLGDHERVVAQDAAAGVGLDKRAGRIPPLALPCIAAKPLVQHRTSRRELICSVAAAVKRRRLRLRGHARR